MTRPAFDLIKEWAALRLTVSPTDYGTPLDRLKDWYLDFQRVNQGKADALSMGQREFARHVRTLDGVKLIRRAPGMSVMGARIKRSGEEPAFEARLNLAAKRPIREANGKPRRVRTLEVAVGALNMIRANDDEPRAKRIADEAVASINASRMI